MKAMRRFSDRREGAAALSDLLAAYAGHPETFVLALARGGVPVGAGIARRLRLPLDVLVVRKLGVPGHEELAFGAIAPGGIAVFNHELVRGLGINGTQIEATIARESAELERRARRYRTGRAAIDPKNKTCILVDDGLATGATMRAALDYVRRREAAEIVVAVPVAARETCNALANGPGESCVCAILPEPLYGVGMWYEDFSQTSDEEVAQLLAMNEFASDNEDQREVGTWQSAKH